MKREVGSISSKERILRLAEVKDRTGLSRSSIYQKIKVGAFPNRIRLGARSVGWLESTIELWILERVEGDRT